MNHYSIMKDRKGNSRGKCLKPSCDCDDYTVEKNFCLCAYCEHTPAAHEELVQDDLNWLKYNMQPWTTVLQKWKATSQYRTMALHNGGKQLDDFKLYADPKADSLLDIDFATICQQNGYPQCSNKLFEMWPLICDKLLAAKPHSSNGDNDITAVKTLVHLTCTKRHIRLTKAAKRRTWCPTVGDCLQSFVIVAQGVDEGENVLAYLRTLYTELQLTLQPLVVSVDGLAVVAYNDYRLKVESLVKGIDLCFKLIQILNLEYNTASFPAWMFLQRFIYKIATRWDTPSPKAAEAATALGL